MKQPLEKAFIVVAVVIAGFVGLFENRLQAQSYQTGSESPATLGARIGRIGNAGVPHLRRGWLVQSATNNIMRIHPLTILKQHKDRCKFLDVGDLKLIEKADGKMLAKPFYHVFEIDGPEASVEWRGAATGNRQVFFSQWTGNNSNYIMMRDERNYKEGLPVRLKLTAAPGEDAIYLMVNCTRGSIATDYLKIEADLPGKKADRKQLRANDVGRQ